MNIRRSIWVLAFTLAPLADLRPNPDDPP